MLFMQSAINLCNNDPTEAHNIAVDDLNEAMVSNLPIVDDRINGFDVVFM